MKLLLYDDWINSASKKDGISPQIEAKVRHEVYVFAREMEKQLKNHSHPNFNYYFQKALSIFHRFSHQKSFRNFDRYIYVVASLFLAAKDEDMFNWSLERYVDDFLACCAQKKDNKQPSYASSLHPINLPRQQGQQQQYSIDEKKKFETKISDAETHILQMLSYDLDIIVPQVYFVEAQKQIKLVTGESEKFWQTAQSYLNDLFITTVALYYQPKVICMASLYLSMRILKFQIEDFQDRQWFQLFDEIQVTETDNKIIQSKQNQNEQTTMDDIIAIQKHFDDNIKAIKY